MILAVYSLFPAIPTENWKKRDNGQNFLKMDLQNFEQNLCNRIKVSSELLLIKVF